MLRELAFITLPNYISTSAALAKINEVFKTLKLSSVIKWLLLHEVCLVAVYTVCVLMLLLCLPSTQIVYMATKQTSYNNNHFIKLNNFNVLKTSLILVRAALVLM